jgi:hypothetical protein
VPLFGTFPTYQRHEDVRCFRCGGKAGLPQQGEDAPGHGQFRAYCPECRMHTWYDLKAKEPS